MSLFNEGAVKGAFVGGELERGLDVLGGVLRRYAPLWRPRPFHHVRLPWESEYADLSQHLRQLTLDEVTAIKRDPVTNVLSLTPFLPELIAAVPWLLKSVGPKSSVPPVPPKGVSQRKWTQINAFASALPAELLTDANVLDWCSGKGHLAARLLRVGAGKVACVEWDPDLARQGHRAYGMPFHRVDVMSAPASQLADGADFVTALHACGDLHRRLYAAAKEHAVRTIAVAPCCYNRTRHDEYDCLSDAGRRVPLVLTKEDLQLPLLGMFVASRRRQQLREREDRYRLGFDLLLREQGSAATYHHLPPVPRGWLADSFESFCRRVAARESLWLPGTTLVPYEARGIERQREVYQLGTVRAAFRRTMELWLVFDQAIALSEQGYQAKVVPFCPLDATPRNLLVLATRECR